MLGSAPEQNENALCLTGTSSRFAVRTILADLTDSLLSWGLAPDNVSVVELVAAEALNNIVEHAFQYQDGEPFEMQASLESEVLILKITDGGRPMPGLVLPATATGELGSPDIDVPEEDLPEGGWGWFLIHDLTRELSYERVEDCNYLTIKMDT